LPVPESGHVGSAEWLRIGAVGELADDVHAAGPCRLSVR
jgi:hypothetical protein